MAENFAVIECFESQDDIFIVHEPERTTVRFSTFEAAEQHCFERGWDIFVVESPWDEEFAEWQ